MKQLFIDARLWGIKHTGIGRYTENLIKYLPKSPDISVTLLVSSQDYHEPCLQKYQRVIAKFHPYSILSQFEMFIIWLRYHPDLLHVTQSGIPVFWMGEFVVTFHDLIKHESVGSATTTKQQWTYWLKYYSLLFIDYLAANKSAHIFVPSSYWKDKLIAAYHLSESKITVTYEGVDNRLVSGSGTTPFCPQSLTFCM